MPTTTVEQLSPTRVKLAVSVPPEELRPSITHAYQHIASEVTIPGFRKGKVPPPIIDQRVGRTAVLEHAVNEGLDGFFRAAVQENNIRPLGRPEADITQWPDAKDFSGDLQVSIEVDVRPEIVLPPLDSITVVVDPVEVTDADVDAQLDELRARFGTLVPVDRPATTGDFVQLDLVAMIGGEQVDTASGISYELGSGELVEGIDEALDSLTPGESTTFSSTLLGGDHEGEQAEISVTVLAVKERELPELDDDFAQLASEFDTLEELRADIVGQVERQKRFAQVAEARDKVTESLLDQIDVPVPQSLIDDEVQRHLEAENRQEDEEHRAEVLESTEQAFRQQLLFDAVAELLDIRVSQDELAQYVVQSAQQYGVQPNEFAQMLQQNGQIPALMGEVARNKAVAVLLGRITIVDTEDRPVDVSDFVPVDEDADDDADGVEAAEVQEAQAEEPEIRSEALPENRD